MLCRCLRGVSSLFVLFLLEFGWGDFCRGSVYWGLGVRGGGVSCSFICIWGLVLEGVVRLLGAPIPSLIVLSSCKISCFVDSCDWNSGFLSLH